MKNNPAQHALFTAAVNFTDATDALSSPKEWPNRGSYKERSVALSKARQKLRTAAVAYAATQSKLIRG